MLYKIVWYDNMFFYWIKAWTNIFHANYSNISKQLKKLNEIVKFGFIPAISGRIIYPDIKRKLLSFPHKLGASSWLTTLPIPDKGHDLTKQLCGFGHIYWRNPQWKISFLCSDVSWLLKDYQLIVNMEQSLICSIFCHPRKVVLFLYVTTKSQISLPDC